MTGGELIKSIPLLIKFSMIKARFPVFNLLVFLISGFMYKINKINMLYKWNLKAR
ncbi:hypothetical protein Xhom_03746 [Xenorhabdus hominickii]|uniref:Uncharacterized protein n=1 Tax=Xenorhabdus hominickii TaxID=351679 RepID=A0A2G0Q3G1_XENHO|nr:hypothetical protein Xhom_04640 [Xenorhabdus hominickii]PHM52951.1 hypothetical protein Xhom_03833 [Xenorhabdus hominickii]PHM53745.1 hypothetical protein Xhom_03746 [Xenorhabdus hominickii]